MEEPQRDTFGTLLRTTRERRARSIAWLVREMARRGSGFSESYLREIEVGGRHPPDLPVVLVIADVLGVAPQALLRLAIRQRGSAELGAVTGQQVAVLGTLAEHWSRLDDAALARIEARVLEVVR